MYYLYLFISSNGTELYSEWLLCLSAVSTREQPLKRAAKFAPASAVPAQPWKIGRIWGKKKTRVFFENDSSDGKLLAKCFAVS